MDKPRPPKTTPVPTDVLLDQALAAPLLQTWLRILALAWRHDYRQTDWMPLDELCRTLGNGKTDRGKMDRATFMRHISQLKALKLLDWTTDGKNRYRFSIVQVRLSQVAKSQFCDPSSSGGGITLLSQENQPLLPEDESQKCDLPQSCDLNAPDAVLDHDAWQALREAGVGEPARTELANLPTVTAWYIRAMAAGAQADGVGIGALIHRIRNDWPAPEWCDKCNGLDGKHAYDCPTGKGRNGLPRDWAEAARIGIELQAERAAERIKQAKAAPAISAEMQEAASLWQQATSELQLQLTTATYSTWLGRASLVGRENGTLVVAVHNGYAKDWLQNRLCGLIDRTLTGIAKRDIHARFIVYGERVGGNDGNSQG